MMKEDTVRIEKEKPNLPILIPEEGRIVVEAIRESQTPSGLFLPATASADQRATVGKIIALSEEYMLGSLSEGDVVLFGANSGMLVDVGWGRERRRAIVLRETEILCRVVNEKGEPYA